MGKKLLPQNPKIGLLISEGSEYGRGVLRGISEFTRSHHEGHFRIEPPSEKGIQNLAEWNPSGLIIKVNNLRLAKLIYSLNQPVVNVCRVSDLEEAFRVQSDDEAVGIMGGQYLLKKKAKMYGYVGIGEGAYIALREYSFQKTIGDAGEPYRSFRHSRKPCQAGDKSALMAWLLQLPKPAAIMTSNDVIGQLVLEVCHEAKLRVPEEVMILGVDNNELISEVTRPGLSSISLQTEEIGRLAADLMWKILKKRDPVGTVFLPPKGVITRGSTESPKMEDPVLATIISTIHSSATDPLILQNIFKKTPLSRHSVERRFRRLLGRTPLQEIHRVRITFAKELLTTTSLPLKAIADDCGYAAPARLIESFIRETGVTPKQFRQRSALKEN